MASSPMSHAVPVAILQDFARWAQDDPTGPRVSPQTADRYRRYARSFCATIGHPAYATSEDVTHWLQRSTTASVSTVNVTTVALRAFFQYLQVKRVRTDNPASHLKTRRVPKRTKRFIERDEITALFTALYEAHPITPELLQDRAILETLYGSGLRRSEVACLPLGALVARDRLRVIGKGNKERFTIVTEKEYLALQAWALAYLADEETLRIRETHGDAQAFVDLRQRTPNLPLFYTLHGKKAGTPICRLADPGHYVATRAKYWMHRVNITEGSAHRFRHSFCTHLISNGAPLTDVKEFAGHAEISTTAEYTGLEGDAFARARALHLRS